MEDRTPAPAEQLASDFVSIVSHELRTPLATVKEFTAILLDSIAGPLTPDQRNYLTIIQGNIARMAHIVDDLLGMAKLEAGRVLLEKRLVDVGELLQQLEQSMQPLAKARQITLEIAAPRRPLTLFADEGKLMEVLTNLVSNAIKYTPGPGRVTVTVEARAAEAEFRVTDTGIGIDPTDVPKLFEKFQQIQRVPGTQGTPGTGLGLAISKRLVELHGGCIGVESRPGKGSAFFFTIPCYQAQELLSECVRSGVAQARQRQASFSAIILAVPGAEVPAPLLASVERRAQETVRQREGDMVLRAPNGSFVVLVPGADRKRCDAIAQRLKQAMEPKVSAVTTAITYPEQALNEEELLQLIRSRLERADMPRRRILVVDDEPQIRYFLTELLELHEFDVMTAANGAEALEALARGPADLILLDLVMPVMDGYQAYQRLKQDPRTRAIPVIIVTAKGDRIDQALGLEPTGAHYVSKPFQMEELLGKIQAVIRKG